MCGACGAAPHDPMAVLVSGPRRRAAVARAAAQHLPNLRIRVVERAWTVADRTGRVAVCRTFGQLLDVLAGHGAVRMVAERDLLRAAALVADSTPVPP